MDTNFTKIKADASPGVATSGTQMQDAFNGNFDKIKQNFTEQQQAIDELKYKALIINNFTGGGTYERGRSIANVNLAWAFNKDVTSQSIVPDVPVLDNTTRAFNLTGVNITTNRTYTLTASDGKTTATKTTAVLFQDSRYFGVSAKDTLTAAEILQLLTGELSGNYVQARTFNCSGGRYFYLGWPSAWGTPQFRVGGLAFSAIVKTIYPTFANASGATLSLDLYRVRDIQTGSNINVEVL